jgi:plasmid stabilization system protein ParE
MARILLRFNTKFEQDPKKRTWRVLEDGIERLASHVSIGTNGETIQEDIDGVPKYHILFDGKILWDEDKAAIISSDLHNSLKTSGTI